MATSASFEARCAPSSTRPPKSSLAGLSYKIRTSISAQIESGGNSWLCSSFCPRGTDAIGRKDDRIRKIEVCPVCNVKALDHFQSRRVYRSLSDNDFRFAGNPRWLRGHYSPRIGNEVRQRDGFFHPTKDYRCDAEEPFRRGHNYFESPANPVESKDGGFALIDNYFRHGNDLICVGKDYLKNGNNPFQRRLNFLQLAHNPLRNERIYFLHQCIHFHRGHIHSREGERFFHGGDDNFRLGHESLRDRNRFPRRGENPRRCADGCVFNTNSSTTNR